MALKIAKSLNELMASALDRLQNTSLPNGKKLSSTPGSTTRLLLAVINAQLEEFYTKLEEVHLQSFVSTATEQGLDLIGDLVDCKRESGESDTNYRTRIKGRVTELERANELSVRMALLSVNGVQDVKLRKFTHGSGSFTAYIITDTAEPSIDIINACHEALEDVAAYGIKYRVEGPDLVPVILGVKLVLLDGTEAPLDLIEEVRDRLREFINSREIGAELIYNEIVEIVMSTSENIYDMEVVEYRINDVAVLNANQSCRPNERFIESNKPNSIYVL